MTRSTTADGSLLTAWASASRSAVGRRASYAASPHAALDDELVGVGRHAEPGEPALDDVESEEFLGRSSFRGVLPFIAASSGNRAGSLCPSPVLPPAACDPGQQAAGILRAHEAAGRRCGFWLPRTTRCW